ncbi:MAG: hypothetical protein ACOC2U_00190 [bacterium]
MSNTIKIGYIGLAKDFVLLRDENKHCDFIFIQNPSDLIGRDFTVIIKGYGWWHVLNKTQDEFTIESRIYFSIAKQELGQWAMKKPFRFWLNKIWTKFKLLW